METNKDVTYGLAAHVRMPDLGIKLHDGRSEGIIIGYPNVNYVSAPLVRSVWRALERTFEMCHIIGLDKIGGNVGKLVGVDISNFFGNSTSTAREHSEEKSE